MQIELLFGRTGLDLELPGDLDVTVVQKPSMPLVADADAAVGRALRSPIGAAPLAELARGRRSACILVCDVTRPVPNHLFLRPVIETLHEAGLAKQDIVVLVATGLHRPNEGEELEAVIGDPWVFAHARVENHFARDTEAHVDLGFTPTRRTPVELDRRFVAADLRIATGLVEPHFMAGYSGGRKVIAPGIAGERTIRTFHSARFMEDPAATSCNLDGNPLHEEQLEIVRMVGEVYALNTVIDDERRLSLVNFGAIHESHQAAVDFVHGYCAVELPRRFRTIVTTSAGYPLDQTYYQTVKGMVTPLAIVDADATLIVASDCGEGLGSSAFRASQARLIESGADDFLTAIMAKSLADIDEWQSEMQVKSQRRARVLLHSNLDAADRALTGVEHIDCIATAVAQSVATSGDKAVAVIPEGPYVVPVATEGGA
ncbi:MAG: nickel-dependent lactate racemase [Gammaproteobacteria bacterium]|nr:nickel-dependent lactate racemase [Gammaproteobacteria bacterium]